MCLGHPGTAINLWCKTSVLLITSRRSRVSCSSTQALSYLASPVHTLAIAKFKKMPVLCDSNMQWAASPSTPSSKVGRVRHHFAGKHRGASGVAAGHDFEPQCEASPLGSGPSFDWDQSKLNCWRFLGLGPISTWIEGECENVPPWCIPSTVMIFPNEMIPINHYHTMSFEVIHVVNL